MGSLWVSNGSGSSNPRIMRANRKKLSKYNQTKEQ